MIKEEDLKRKIETLKKFSDELNIDSENEIEPYIKGGFSGMSKAYKQAAEMLEGLLEDR